MMPETTVGIRGQAAISSPGLDWGRVRLPDIKRVRRADSRNGARRALPVLFSNLQDHIPGLDCTKSASD
jgi:hypothetical protein